MQIGEMLFFLSNRLNRFATLGCMNEALLLSVFGRVSHSIPTESGTFSALVVLGSPQRDPCHHQAALDVVARLSYLVDS